MSNECALCGAPQHQGTKNCLCRACETCAHCGRSFAESHNRTHGDKPATTTKPQLRLL